MRVSTNGSLPSLHLLSHRVEVSPHMVTGLSFIYMMWLLTVGMLYFPCRWFAKLKQRRKDWWLSYL
jgi:hypothetical protein